MKGLMPRHASGFSLIELMVALAAGMIVIGSVLAFTMSMLRSYNENIRSTRLTQDLRAAMNFAMREVRRSGYDSTSVTRVMTDNNPAPSFAGLTVSAGGDCVAYQYDRDDTLENRALRLNATTGALEAKVSTAAVSCADTSGWAQVSDPGVIELTRFQVTQRTSPFCVVLQSKPDPANPAVTIYDKAEGSVRNLSLCMKARLRADSTLSRNIADSSRSRAEQVVFTKDSPTGCPAAAAILPSALATPSALNTTCGAP